MKIFKPLLSAWLLLLALSLNAQNHNFTLVGHLDYTQDLNDIWGHVDATGNEYALVGARDGFSVVSLANPSTPVEIQFFSGPSSTWRDIKVWNNHAYVTNETSNGLLIVDMSGLPATAGNMPFKYYTYGGQLTTAHNIFIDSAGFAYLFGANIGNGGALILDLNQDPWNPTYKGIFDDYYLHDGMVQGDTLWGSAVYQGVFSKIDVSNKTAPMAIGTNSTPNNFTHNAWITDDSKTLFTTDEVSGGYIGVYDVSDMNNVVELDRIQSSPGSGVIPHNVHVLGDHIVTSYYRDGIIIHDVTYPYNVIEVARYDSSPLTGNGFNGSWGAYPYLPSGLQLNADIEGGLDVLSSTFPKACYLEGMVTDAGTSAPISDVDVIDLSGEFTGKTGLMGTYATGTVLSGSYDVVFDKAGYFADTVTVSLSNGVLTIQDVQLVQQANFTLTGKVEDAVSGQGIANAEVEIKGNNFLFNATTDANGDFQIPSFYAGTYEVIAGKWEYHTKCNNLTLTQGNNAVIQLDPGYSDDFTFDFGWTVQTNALSGDWERVVPAGTDLNGVPMNPGADVSTDCSNKAFVTGNDNSSVGNDDIDNGTTLLFSPVMDLSSYQEPYINMDLWFANDGGQGSPNDSMIVYLSDGSNNVRVDFLTGIQTWTSKSYKVSDFVSSNQIQLIISAGDYGPGHIAEGGFDNMKVTEGAGISVNPEVEIATLNVYPNPSNAGFTLNLPEGVDQAQLSVFDLSGRMLGTFLVNEQTFNLDTDLARGVYLLRLEGQKGDFLGQTRWIKQ